MWDCLAIQGAGKDYRWVIRDSGIRGSGVPPTVCVGVPSACISTVTGRRSRSLKMALAESQGPPRPPIPVLESVPSLRGLPPAPTNGSSFDIYPPEL